MNEETERRLKKLVDPAVMTDPVYAAMVRAFRSWLEASEMAMRDEGVSNSVIHAVLNRMVYGTPTGPATDPEMITVRKDFVEELVMNRDPRRHLRLEGFPSMGGSTKPSRNAPGQRDVSDIPRPPQ